MRHPAHIEDEQRGRVAHTIHAHHQPPLRLRGALEEVLGVARERIAHGDEKERIDRDEDHEEAIPAVGERPVVQRQNDEE